MPHRIDNELPDIGRINGPLVGVFLKELIRRGIIEIRAQRDQFEKTHKPSKHRPNDWVTTADLWVQAFYVRLILEHLPGVGIIAEELGVNIPCTIPGLNLVITLDPIDGTGAYVRGQSDGVATQFALVDYTVGRGVVLAAFVGNVNTGEIFGYRPGSDNVHRIFELRRSVHLNELPRRVKLGSSNAVLRDHPALYGPRVQLLVAPGGPLHGITVDSGSMTLTMAKLWSGEVALVVIQPYTETPWDSSPLIGISEKLGFVSYRVTRGGRLVRHLVPVRPDCFWRSREIIWVHACNRLQLLEWARLTPVA